MAKRKDVAIELPPKRHGKSAAIGFAAYQLKKDGTVVYFVKRGAPPKPKRRGRK